MNNIDFDSKRALHYEDLARKAVFGYDQLYTMALSLLSCEIKEHANILVVGCGTGMELTTFGSNMPGWKLTGVDPSEEMIKIAQSKVEQHGLTSRIKLHKGTVETLSEENTFDSATLFFVIRFVPDDNRKFFLLQSIFKRLKTGAKLIIVDQYGDLSSEHFRLLLKGWKKYMLFSGASSELVDKIVNQALEQRFITEARIQKLLSEAGFNKVNLFYNSFLHAGWIAEKE